MVQEGRHARAAKDTVMAFTADEGAGLWDAPPRIRHYKTRVRAPVENILRTEKIRKQGRNKGKTKEKNGEGKDGEGFPFHRQVDVEGCGLQPPEKP